jgi:hypothetical protein
MKILFKIIVIVISTLHSGITYSQNNFVTLTSSDFIKGLDKKDYLREKLLENGLTKTGKEADGINEYWSYKSLLLVDIIYSPGNENTIKVGIYDTLAGFPKRLIQSFPHKNGGRSDENLAAVNAAPLNKKISYSLKYSRDTDYVAVVIWFDDPYYFFEYNKEK